ncbi:hypothetical protein ACQKI4_30595, partial [Paenibacillus glucanolyticus]
TWKPIIRESSPSQPSQQPETIFENRLFQEQLISDLAYNKPKSLIPFAKEYGVHLEERYSKVTQSMYVMHICPHCKMHQGDNYVVEDNEQKTDLVRRMRIVFDNGIWREIR